MGWRWRWRDWLDCVIGAVLDDPPRIDIADKIYWSGRKMWLRQAEIGPDGDDPTWNHWRDIGGEG